jgi:hypothetical protein
MLVEPFRRHDPPKCTQAEFDPPKCTEAEIDPPKGRFSASQPPLPACSSLI